LADEGVSGGGELLFPACGQQVERGGLLGRGRRLESPPVWLPVTAALVVEPLGEVVADHQVSSGPKRGLTWLNAINDRGMGRGAKIVSGTVRDCLHMVDVIFGLDGGELPEIVVSGTGSYSDVVFGLLELLGISYGPRWRTLPDRKGGRIKGDADYGPLNTFARGKADLAKIRREDILPGCRLHLHRDRPGLRRRDDAPARRAPDRAGRGDRDVRADLQVPAHPQLLDVDET
jgi:Tn3 transposase DDE domain